MYKLSSRPAAVLLIFAILFIATQVIATQVIPTQVIAADGQARDNVAKSKTQPQWIWGGPDREADQSITLQRSFHVQGPVVASGLRLAADFTSCRVLLNGRLLLEIDEYSPWQNIDLTDRLKRGENTLQLRCRSGAGPAAVAATLDLRTRSDGSPPAERQAVYHSDESWLARDASAAGGAWRPAARLGSVASEMWDSTSTARVSAFDDYEQWRRASGGKRGVDPATFRTRPGFEVALVYSAAADEGSWVSMAFDPQGRLTIAREDKGLLRLTFNDEGDRVERVEPVNDSLLEARGLLYAHGSLFVNANNSKGMYRLTDTSRDGRFDEVKLLREFPGGVGHGRNDLALGPDGWIYSIHGDAVDLPRKNIVDRTSPFRAARKGAPSFEGCLIRTNRDGTKWELVAAGLRNPFGIDFNAEGDLFTYDADHEYDMGAPWYRPTRIDQLFSGADFGWRRIPSGNWPPYFPDHPDNALPVTDVGKGSPTAVKSGGKSNFPEHYRRAIFALDWAYGRVLACHFSPRGAGYNCRVEQFLQGRPLNVTDLDFGPDGSMYLVTGGRKTQSALYRVRPVRGAQVDSEVDNEIDETSLQLTAAKSFSAEARATRRRLSGLHRESGPEAVAIAWSSLGSSDPMLRNAARVAVEHQPMERWQTRALHESQPEVVATALMALARSGRRDLFDRILTRLNQLDREAVSAHGSLSIIHAYRLCLKDPEGLAPEVVDATRRRLLAWFQHRCELRHDLVAPVGSGETVRRELGRLVSQLRIEGAIPLLMQVLQTSVTQRHRMLALFMLCRQTEGWTIDQRRRFFTDLGELERSAFSGQGMPGRLQQIRDRATKSLSDAERLALGELLKPTATNAPPIAAVNRPFVRKWTIPDLAAALGELKTEGDATRGERLFQQVQCAACHRMNGRGGVIGPDLSALVGRFSRKDILSSIVQPSEVIAEKYRGIQVETTSGKRISGHVAIGGDYRASILRLVEDPLRPGDVTEIQKKDILAHQPSNVSLMPTGLLDTLKPREVQDLLAFLRSTGPAKPSPKRLPND